MNHDTQLILNEISNLRTEMHEHFAASETAFDAKLDKRFAASEAAFDAKLDKRFAASEAAFDAKLDKRFAAFEAAFDAKLDKRFLDFQHQMDKRFAASEAAFDAKLDKRFAASENLVLEEVERTRSILEGKIDAVKKDVQVLKEQARTHQLDHDNIQLLFQMMNHLQVQNANFKQQV